MAPVKRTTISRLLICNRGEIARRIIRTCKRLGIYTIAIYSTADKCAPFTSEADEAHWLKSSSSAAADTYLDIDKILCIARASKADAIHPGYGFLSENAVFAARCEEEGINFIGPSAHAIRSMGSKSEAKNLLTEHEPTVPLIPGYNGDDQSHDRLVSEALKIGFPVLIKAAAGGGGKGMRVVRREEDIKDELQATMREAQSYFGDSRVLLERYFDSVRHIEVQIMGDKHGNVIHCFERECTIQRRYQKVVEETPSIALTPELRERITSAAVKIGKRINYVGAGTVEFILDTQGRFYFLEVNTRLQVEHPVTEFVTGLDLVEIQIRAAEGHCLYKDLHLDSLELKGHAIEVRLYAEDPKKNFFPCSGKLLLWGPARDIEGMRYDSGVETGSEISIYYDPMIAKIIAYGATRLEALARLVSALERTVVAGLTTNITFLKDILLHPEFVSGNFDTAFIEQHFPSLSSPTIAPPPVSLPLNVPVDVLSAALMWDWSHRNNNRSLLRNVRAGFRNNPYRKQWLTVRTEWGTYRLFYEVIHEHHPVAMDQESGVDGSVGSSSATEVQPPSFTVSIALQEDGKHLTSHYGSAPDAKPHLVTLLSASDDGAPHSEERVGHLQVCVDGVKSGFWAVEPRENPNLNTSGGERALFLHNVATGNIQVSLLPRLPISASEEGAAAETQYTAPMHAKILKILVKSGEKVNKGQGLLVIESMKMENRVCAASEGQVEVFVEEGEVVDAGTRMVHVGSSA